MKLSELNNMTTNELVQKYNTLRAKVAKTPRRIRLNTMPKAGQTLQIIRDEVQRRATEGDNLLHELNH